jgi:protein SCO1/2/putative membrane protein
MDVHQLPAVNAVLNGTAAMLLLRGYLLIRAGKRDQHKKTMIAAFCVSAVFLACYLVYHANVGAVYFQKTGFVRYVYLTILFTHTALAAAVPILAIITLRRALKAEKSGDFKRHRRIARWTLPIWLYVSVTGVVVYFMLFWL